MRFVIAKNSGSPVMTTQSAGIPTPRVYPSSVPSISATPPPLAVELTFTMRRAPSSAWKSTARASSSATRSCPMIGSSRRGSSGGTSTVLPRVDATGEVSRIPRRVAVREAIRRTIGCSDAERRSRRGRGDLGRRTALRLRRRDGRPRRARRRIRRDRRRPPGVRDERGHGLAATGSVASPRASSAWRAGCSRGPTGPSARLPTRVAAPAEVARWLDAARPARAVLDVGSLTFADGVPLALDAGAFDRHTFLCGQSGSGKTYALGDDPRAAARRDVAPHRDPRPELGLRPPARSCVTTSATTCAPRYEARADGIVVGAQATTGRTGFTSASATSTRPSRRRVLRLDPIADRDEYAALVDAVERADQSAATVARDGRAAAGRARRLRPLGARARNLGVDRWQVWSRQRRRVARGSRPAGRAAVPRRRPRLARDARGAGAWPPRRVLAALWRRRGGARAAC